jgi:TonB family protein
MECKEFEKLLWDGPGSLTPQMEDHIKTCPRCRESYARFRQMFELAEQSEVDRSEAFWQNFNSTVWEKIDKTESKPETSSLRLWQRPATNFRRLSISAGLAVVTVVILVVMVTDLTKKAPPPSQPAMADNYRTFDVQLITPPGESKEMASAEKPADKDLAKKSVEAQPRSEMDEGKKHVEPQPPSYNELAKPAVLGKVAQVPQEITATADTSAQLKLAENTPEVGSIRGGRAMDIMAVASPDSQRPMEAAVSSMVVGEKRPPVPDLPQITADTSQMITFHQFSILAEPKIEQKGDSGSVSIDAVYLTDDGLKDKQITIAQSVLTDDVVINKPDRISLSRGMVQQTPLAEPRIISLSKMPHPRHLATPAYPSLAYSLGKEGEVWVKAFVGASGKVEKAEIYGDSKSEYGFEEEALASAYKNEFEPLEIDGQKMPAWIIYKVRFVRAK